jgi:hypothetical protein
MRSETRADTNCTSIGTGFIVSRTAARVAVLFMPSKNGSRRATNEPQCVFAADHQRYLRTTRAENSTTHHISDTPTGTCRPQAVEPSGSRNVNGVSHLSHSGFFTLTFGRLYRVFPQLHLNNSRNCLNSFQRTSSSPIDPLALGFS